jgi:hypothetical protein
VAVRNTSPRALLSPCSLKGLRRAGPARPWLTLECANRETKKYTLDLLRGKSSRLHMLQRLCVLALLEIVFSKK